MPVIPCPAKEARMRDQEEVQTADCRLTRPAFLGLIHASSVVDRDVSPSAFIPYNLVDVSRLTPSGVGIVHHQALPTGVKLGFMAYDREARTWRAYRARVVHSAPIPDLCDCYACDLDFLEDTDACTPDEAPLARDLEFLTSTALLGAIPQHALLHLINCLQRRTFQPGEHLFYQGGAGRSLYIIESGVCAFVVTTDHEVHPVCRLHRGEVCGAMSVLTGEPRRGHAVAEDEVVAWELQREDFERVSDRHPELRIFLTELVTQRLESWSYTGDRTVGKYTIRHRIGSGGYGIVYRGYHVRLGMPVAIKMLKHDMAMDPHFLETFRREAQTIARLNHHNIVQIFDIDEIYRTIFIIMEYLEGESLRTVLKKRGALPVPEAINYLNQILAGLEYAHQHGIIHRDIKPENIFRLQDGRVKILDFGLAATPGEEDLTLDTTIFYAAPEQIEGEPEDARTDIYALGILAFELLSGRRPYPEDDLSCLMDLHCQEEIPDPSVHIPDLPPELRAFIRQCSRIDPRARFASAEDAKRVLTQLAQRLSIADVREKRLLTSVFLVYPENQRQALTRLLEEFSQRAGEHGILIKTNEAMDI
jgi:serine/threonine protein kinase